MKKTITIYVPAYNRPYDLEILIKSYLLQANKNTHILISDDQGSPEIYKVVEKYQQKSDCIIYHRNNINLGFCQNLRQAFSISKGDYILFMGDDDVFIDKNALDYFFKAFSKKDVGIVKARQVLYKGTKIDQVYPIKNKYGSIQFYNKGIDSLENLWFESLSITGLAFINNSTIKKLVNNNATLYPQVELMAKALVYYKSASIERYLVGVQSHKKQLNCTIYKLNGKPTTIIDDWYDIYKRMQSYYKKKRINFISKKEYLKKLSSFIALFFPYTSLVSGRSKVILLSKTVIRYYKQALFIPFFIISSIISIVFPKYLIQFVLRFVKNTKKRHYLTDERYRQINEIIYSLYK